MRVPWGEWAGHGGLICFRVFFANGREMTYDDVEWGSAAPRRVWSNDRAHIEKALICYRGLRLAAGLPLDRVLVRVYTNPEGGLRLDCVGELEVEW